MLIGEVGARKGDALKLGIVGSCRVHDPLKEAVREAGGRFVWSAHNAFTHSPPDAIQHIDFLAGRVEFPDTFAPYILRQDKMPRIDPQVAGLISALDVLVVEFSSLQVLRCGSYFFNLDYFAQMFARGKGLPILNWHRALMEGSPVEALVPAAEEAMKAAGVEISPSIREILRFTRREVLGREEMAEGMRNLAARAPRVIFASIFNVPGLPDHTATARSELAAQVTSIAEELGCEAIDPSPLIGLHGREAALDGEGADIFHYAPAFLHTAGTSLLDVIRGEKGKNAASVLK